MCFTLKRVGTGESSISTPFFVEKFGCSIRMGFPSREFWKATLTGNGFPWLYASGELRSQSSKVASFTGRTSVKKRSVARQAESGDLETT